MKYNISIKIGAVFQSIARERMFKFSSDKIDEAIDIVKDLIPEVLSFPEKDVKEKALKKKFPDIEKISVINWLNLGYKSDVGRVRDLDEDSIVILAVEIASRGKIISRTSLFVLGDGVGGNTKGEVASYFGTKTVAEDLINSILSISEKTDIEIEESIRNSIKKANKVIYDHVKIHPEYGGMATTLVAALLKNNKLFVGNVGDSRAYLINDGIKQITIDHSAVQEMVAAGKITKEAARNHPQKNIVTRAVGYYQDVNVDVFKEDIYKEDTIMLCCDGLSDMLRDDEIKNIIVKSKDFTKACDGLVRIANENGGRDNISVILSRSNDLPSKIKTIEIPIITEFEATMKKIKMPIAYAIIAMILLLGLYLLLPAPVITSWGNNMPHAPVNLSNTSGSNWVNYTWRPGIGNITNSYNISVNGTWTNGSTQTWINTTTTQSGWVNITVYAFNSSGTGTLNLTGIQQNTQVLAAQNQQRKLNSDNKSK